MYEVHLQRYDNFAASPTFSLPILIKLLSRSVLPRFIPQDRSAPIDFRDTIRHTVFRIRRIIFRIRRIIVRIRHIIFRIRRIFLGAQLLRDSILPMASFLSLHGANNSYCFASIPHFLFAKTLRGSFGKNFSESKKIVVEKFGKLKCCFP